MLEENGGVLTAQRLIRSETPSEGFTVLWEHQRLDLTVEALAILPWFAGLFADEEVEAAKRRLADYRFDVATYLSNASAKLPNWAGE
jgi:hypothetical protein